MKFHTLALAACALFATATAAHAVPVSGQFSINGYVASIGSTSLDMATGLNFVNADGSDNGSSPGAITNFGATSGTFAGLSCLGGSCGTIKDITSFATSAPLASFLTLTTTNGVAISFDVNSFAVTSRSGGGIVLQANGTVHETGYNDSAAQFILTAQGNTITSFSAQTTTTAVPEPASLALLGGSLAVVGLVRRRSKSV